MSSHHVFVAADADGVDDPPRGRDDGHAHQGERGARGDLLARRDLDRLQVPGDGRPDHQHGAACVNRLIALGLAKRKVKVTQPKAAAGATSEKRLNAPSEAGLLAIAEPLPDDD